MTKLTFAWQILLITIVGPLVNIPQLTISRDFKINADLSRLELSFEVAYEQINKPVNQLNGSYVKALERLFKTESSGGRLDSAVQIKKEIGGFGNGSDFDINAFSKRKSKNDALEKVRQKYLSERFRLRKLSRESRNELAQHYRAALKKYELEQTKIGEVEVALIARKMHDEFDATPRYSDKAELPTGDRFFKGIVHFVGKGEIELHLNGTRVSYRNSADKKTQYVDGKSRPQTFRIGDVLRVRMRSTSVYRSLIMAIKSDEDNLSVPITVKDYRFGGTSIRSEDLELEKVIQITTRPDKGSPDINMDAMWEKKSLSPPSRTNSEWMKIGTSANWHTYFIIIEENMLFPAK